MVIVVCDSAASEACPIWFNNLVKAGWGLPDPSKVGGAEVEIQSAFHSVMDTIETRIRAFLALDLEGMSGADLQSALQCLAEDS